MLITHSKSLTIADSTNTGIVRPSNWNEGHVGNITILGNTAGVSSWSGTNLQFSGAGDITLSLTGNTLRLGGRVSSYVPMMPGGSTASQTLCGMGSTSASALFFPITLTQEVALNIVRLALNASWVSSAASYTQQLTMGVGLYSNNAQTLQSMARTSWSYTLSGSSISGTISMPTNTSLSGYASNTTTWAVTASGQNLIGTAGVRLVDAQFGASTLLSPGIYWVGVHIKQATAGAAGGLQIGLHGAVVPMLGNAGQIGISTAAQTGSTILRAPLSGLGLATSTASANYGGTTVPQDYPLGNMNFGVSVWPYCILLST